MELVYSLVSVGLISLISLIGIFTISVNKKFLNKIITLLISLAAGTLIGDVFLHILPEIEHEVGFGIEAGLLIIFGILIFFILEKIIHWRHCHHVTSKNHPHSLGLTNLVGDGLHNFIDGLIIGASFAANTELGIATTVAVVLHEIPQEIGDFGVLIHAGYSRLKALLFNFVSATLAFAGVLVAFIFGESIESSSFYLLATAAGGFLYIAIADLIPEIKHEDNAKKSILQLAFILIGIIAMIGITYVEPHDHGEEDHSHEETHSEDEHEEDGHEEEDGYSKEHSD